MSQMRPILPGVYEIQLGKKRSFYTKNLVPGKSVYGERLWQEGEDEFREWQPMQSKLAAALHNGLKDIGLKDDSVVLYLGASTGTTVSHVSDIAANGMIFAVESAPRVMRELIFLAEQRSNIAPIFADASQPQLFAKRCAKASWLYQDISQKQQAEIFLKNVAAFLNKGSYAFLAVKARSIDVRRKPDEIFAEVRAQLSAKLKIIQEIKLEPYQKDHCMFVCKY